MAGEENQVCVFYGEELARYGFGHGHPFGTDRLASFWKGFVDSGLAQQVQVCEPVSASREEIEAFHTTEYVKQVILQSASGDGYLDYGDTPAYLGVYESAATVVGSSLAAAERVIAGECRRAFVPIAGLHHAHRGRAGGFCVFNDCAVVIELMRKRHGLQRIAYVDIDAHHGDGVYYCFENDPEVFTADIHEDGRFLFPGTGFAYENGKGAAKGTKLNIPVRPGADDTIFAEAWKQIEELVDSARPELILLQCGADSLAGDPLTHMRYTTAAHQKAAAQLCRIADSHCNGRILAMGGGGYNHQNLVAAWSTVVRAFLGS
jgi:acetoin utilization protein AcuC